jgi:hypothetical protein
MALEMTERRYLTRTMDKNKIDINDGAGQSCARQSNVDKGRDIDVQVKVSQVTYISH